MQRAGPRASVAWTEPSDGDRLAGRLQDVFPASGSSSEDLDPLADPLWSAPGTGRSEPPESGSGS